MTTPALTSSPTEIHRLTALLVLVTASLMVFGVLVAGSAESLIVYLLITTFAVLPAGLWIWTGARGIPILSAVSAFHYIYYAMPVLRHEFVLTYYAPFEILRAGFTTALYLIAATASSALFLWGRPHRLRTASQEILAGRGKTLLVFLGLGLGILYYVAVFSGLPTVLGPLFGLFRSVMLTATLMGCFMLGHARAQGVLRGVNWAFAVGCMGAIVACAVATLFLIGGVIDCMAAVFGFVITRKQVPLKFLGVVAVVIVVLHAGKSEMREKYWLANSGAEISITQVPEFLVEWGVTGFTKLISGQVYSSAIDRASLIQLVLLVQRLSPDRIPYLNGETYAQIPNMVVPRFINPEKQVSQYGMSLLNVRYGLQTQEETKKTAIGWGLLTESFANFGYLGVIGVGFLLGCISGLFERISVGAEVISLPTLLAVTVLLLLINLEADATALLSSLAQSLAAVTVFFGMFRMISKRQARSLQSVHQSAVSARRVPGVVKG